MAANTEKLEAALRENMRKRKAQAAAKQQARDTKMASPPLHEPLEPHTKPD